MKLNVFKLIFLGLLFAPWGGVYAQGNELDVWVRGFEGRVLEDTADINGHKLDKLTLGQSNRLALVAAKSLSIDDYISAIGDNTLYEHFTQAAAKDSPAEAECRLQWGLNKRAAGLLRELSEKRQINKNQIIPYLIKAMDHPDKSWVARPCFQILTNLTRHRFGEDYWRIGKEDTVKHKEITKWWQQWWERNKDNQVIIDKQLEQRVRKEVLSIAKKIVQNIKPSYPELSMFDVPKDLRLDWFSPIFKILYAPRNFAIFHPMSVRRDDLPWLYIGASFLSDEMGNPNRTPYSLYPDLKDNTQTVYSKVLEGTEIVIKVKLASSNEQLIRDVKKELNNPQRVVPQNWQDLLGDMDSVVVLTLDSMKPAKVAIYNCTVKWTLLGVIPPPELQLNFLHFPNAKRMKVGDTYLCFIRENSGTSFSLIRSDMYFPNMDKKEIYNYFWEPDSLQAKAIERQIN